jgi:antitoxin MazE
MELEIEKKITKVGNSLGVTIPAEIAKLADLEAGEIVYLTVNSISNEITIRKSPQKEDSFRKLVIGIVEEYLENKE